MTQEKSKGLTIKTTRWEDSEWAWVGEVAKSVGMSRSDFVRQTVMMAAQATAAGLAPYFVGGPQATPQNTGANHFLEPIAQQGVEGSGLRRSRTPQEPEAKGGLSSGGTKGGPSPHELPAKPFRRAGKS
jgi:hypothetical protein